MQKVYVIDNLCVLMCNAYKRRRGTYQVILNKITRNMSLCCACSTLVKWNGQTQHMHSAYRMGFCSNLTHSTTAIADGGPLHKENIL